MKKAYGCSRREALIPLPSRRFREINLKLVGRDEQPPTQNRYRLLSGFDGNAVPLKRHVIKTV